MKATFLHDILKEELYVEKPRGFKEHNRKTHVCRLKKSLYGLKKAPKGWYACIDRYLMNLGFTIRSFDPNLYYKVVEVMPLIFVLYVDDLFLIGGKPLILKCRREFTSEFEMKELGLHYFLALEVWQRHGEIFLFQGKYILK